MHYPSMDGEITSGTMQKLLGVNKVALNNHYNTLSNVETGRHGGDETLAVIKKALERGGAEPALRD
jgi:hypothetical protein